MGSVPQMLARRAAMLQQHPVEQQHPRGKHRVPAAGSVGRKGGSREQPSCFSHRCALRSLTPLASASVVQFTSCFSHRCAMRSLTPLASARAVQFFHLRACVLIIPLEGQAESGWVGGWVIEGALGGVA
eukprot:11025157-Lingulodinium_polyedra.AAC.1